MTSNVETLIVGGGPTGLGAAWRLQEARRDWLLVEAADHFGGLASSFVDGQGFTWDLGGHVHFSHYDTFDRYMSFALGEEGWLTHRRESWIRMRGRYIPYPFQNNVHHLPEPERAACLAGLEAAAAHPRAARPANFDEWMLLTFGPGIADAFMRPYNFKVWAYPPSRLDWNWIGERVAVPDYGKLLAALRAGRDDRSWGPNHTFQFPCRGGTGSLYAVLGARLPADRVRLRAPVVRIDAAAHEAWTEDGSRLRYGTLISTMPLDRLAAATPGAEAGDAAARLVCSSVHVVGVGIDGQPPESLRTKCWMYFPEPHSPYYRVTVFSNYSPNNVARPGAQWSLMAEVSESPAKPVRREALVDDVLRAMREDGLLPAGATIASTVVRWLPQAYPTPFLGRDAVVDPLLRRFEAHGIYSRGRFGAWKYEVGNEDHSFAQGYECANRLLAGGGPECEPTLHTPGVVNARRNP